MMNSILCLLDHGRNGTRICFYTPFLGKRGEIYNAHIYFVIALND